MIYVPPEPEQRRGRPVSGLNARIEKRGNHYSVRADFSAQSVHPWQVHCVPGPSADDPRLLEWHAYVEPGFVNGRDATIAMPTLDGQGKPSSSEVELSAEDTPYLVLRNWRNPLAPGGVTAGFLGDLVVASGEGYPAFFQTLGVKPPAAGGHVFQDANALGSPQEDGRTREIRAADIFLSVPRTATRNDITIQEPATEQQGITISTAFLTTPRIAPFQLRATPRWTPPLEATLLDRFLGTAAEPQTDELKIATVWMVSPPGAAPDAEVDETWTPYPQHFVFWNLMHASRRLLPNLPPSPLTLHTGLAFGIGDVLFAAILAPVNGFLQAITAYFNAATFKGEFWST